MEEQDIRVIKLMNSETIIAEVIYEGEEGFMDIINPLIMKEHQDSGYLGTFLAEWVSISADELFSVPYYSIIISTPVKYAVGVHYNEVVNKMNGGKEELEEVFNGEKETDDIYMKRALRNFRFQANTAVH